MATSKTNPNPSDFEEYVRDLLECPVCMDTIKSVPIYQCSNGHLICKDCIEKLNNCPICRNDSPLVRNLKLENIVQRLDGIHPENEGTTTVKPNLQKWGKGSVRVYGTINGPNSNRQVNNRDVEAALQGERVENRATLIVKFKLGLFILIFLLAVLIFALFIFLFFYFLKFILEQFNIRLI